MCARIVVPDFSVSGSLRPDMKDGLVRAGELGSDSKWSSAIPLRARKKACGDIGVGTLILTTTDISANEAAMLGARLTAQQAARPTHSGPQDRSMLCVRRADRTSEQ